MEEVERKKEARFGRLRGYKFLDERMKLLALNLFYGREPARHGSGQEVGLVLGLLIAAMQCNHTVVVTQQIAKRRILL